MGQKILPLSLDADTSPIAHANLDSSIQQYYMETTSPIYGIYYQFFILNDGKEKKDGKLFAIRHDLKGHQGTPISSLLTHTKKALFTVQNLVHVYIKLKLYDEMGKLIASGSFDKTIRLWDFSSSQKEVYFQYTHINIVCNSKQASNGCL